MSFFGIGGNDSSSRTSHSHSQGAFVRPHQSPHRSNSHHYYDDRSRHHGSSHHHSRSPSSKTSYHYARPSKSTHGGTSSYKRRSRDGYIQRLLHKIRRALHKLYAYVRRHPFKALFPVVMALVSSGALAGLARQMNWPLPRVVADAIGAGRSARGGYDAWFGGDGGRGAQFVRRREVEGDGWLGGDSAGMLKGAVKFASNFM